MKDYDKISENLMDELISTGKELKELADKITLVRLEMRATRLLVESNVKRLDEARSILLSIAVQELINTSWDNCMALLKAKREDLW